jgi:hypothetical protein
LKIEGQKQNLLFLAMPRTPNTKLEAQSMTHAKFLALNLLLSKPKVGG